jgi:hypothetical protein
MGKTTPCTPARVNESITRIVVAKHSSTASDRYQRKQLQDGLGQASLAALVDLRRQRRHIDRQERALRDRIAELLSLGAGAEPGQYRARVHTWEQPRLTWKSLTTVLGEEACGRLRRALPTMTVTRLSVTDRNAQPRRRDGGDR